MKRVVSYLLAAAVMLLVGSVAYSGDMAKGGAKSAAKAAKGHYMVIVPHTADQCLAALDEINAMGPKALADWDFGCKSGDHTAYRMVTAGSEDEVRAMIPASGRDQAKIVKVGKFSMADLKMAHQEMDKH